MRNGLGCITVPFFVVFFSIFAVVISVFIFNAWYLTGGEKTTAEPVSGVITQAYPIPTSDNGMTGYRLVMTLEDETEEVFNILPSIAMKQTNSALVFSKVKVGDHVSATATGFKGLLWWPGYYRNIYYIKVK